MLNPVRKLTAKTILNLWTRQQTPPEESNYRINEHLYSQYKAIKMEMYPHPDPKMLSNCIPQYSFLLGEKLGENGRVDTDELIGRKFRKKETGELYTCTVVAYHQLGLLDGELGLTKTVLLINDETDSSWHGGWEHVSGKLTESVKSDLEFSHERFEILPL